MDLVRLELTSTCLQGRRSSSWSYRPEVVSSQGVEPRGVPKEGWVTASCSRQCCSLLVCIGADSGDRTRDINVGNVVLYH